MSSQPLTIDEFRTRFPAFTALLFPDESVQIRLNLADKFFSETLWKDSDLRKHVMGLYTAHFLMMVGSKGSGGPGKSDPASGLVSSKSVDGASVSFDTGSTSWAGAGFWNQTPYGRELWYLMQHFGAGAVQL